LYQKIQRDKMMLTIVHYQNYSIDMPLPGITDLQRRFNEIRAATLPIVRRLIHDGEKWFSVRNNAKTREIVTALERLAEAVILKEDRQDLFRDSREFQRLSPIDRRVIDDIDFSTTSTMLDLHFSVYIPEYIGDYSGDDGYDREIHRSAYWEAQLSVREALNIARLNIFNLMTLGFFGPLTGRSTSLVRVEEALHLVESTGVRTGLG